MLLSINIPLLTFCCLEKISSELVEAAVNLIKIFSQSLTFLARNDFIFVMSVTDHMFSYYHISYFYAPNFEKYWFGPVPPSVHLSVRLSITLDS